ncbi:MAG: hypothetical protein KatS3mg002_1455 [Candidatus Woesearchaeota archaeon]|nr:MAG: hypothetical protein KatS3mg002_1455 [Candidatus Woesearchaeota archaeon]
MKYNKEFDLIISSRHIQNFTDIEKGLNNIKKAGEKYILTF